jgi:hypothetical protein
VGLYAGVEVMGGAAGELDGVALGDEVYVVGGAIEEEVADGATDEPEGYAGSIGSSDDARDSGADVAG